VPCVVVVVVVFVTDFDLQQPKASVFFLRLATAKGTTGLDATSSAGNKGLYYPGITL
jgi:hypothetical protein